MILDMEQSVLNGCLKNKEYFSAKMGIYPRTLFIVKGKNKQKVIRDNFMARTGDELTFNDKNIPVEACEWEVIEKKSSGLVGS